MRRNKRPGPCRGYLIEFWLETALDIQAKNVAEFPKTLLALADVVCRSIVVDRSKEVVTSVVEIGNAGAQCHAVDILVFDKESRERLAGSEYESLVEANRRMTLIKPTEDARGPLGAGKVLSQRSFEVDVVVIGDWPAVSEEISQN